MQIRTSPVCRLTIMTTATILLGGCGKPAGEPRTAEEVAAEAAELAKPLAGQYETTVRLIEFSVPGLPPQQAEKLRAMMGNIDGETQTTCLTQQEADKGFEESVRKLSEGRGGMTCAYNRFDVDGGAFAAEMACKGPQGMTADLTIEGTTSATATSMTMDMRQKAAMIPGGGINMTMKLEARRTGDCA
jgi:hypothetical protein